MSINFRLVPLPIAEFLPLFELSDEQLQERSAQWLVADANPGYPCRVSLSDAEIGERVLAISFIHHDVRSPYRASGPVFVRKDARAANLEVNEVPIMFQHRLLSLRAYDSCGMMISAKTVPGAELVHAITQHFEDPCVDYQHIHNASPGCFNCAVSRA
jgi:hypothetical protein